MHALAAVHDTLFSEPCGGPLSGGADWIDHPAASAGPLAALAATNVMSRAASGMAIVGTRLDPALPLPLVGISPLCLAPLPLRRVIVRNVRIGLAARGNTKERFIVHVQGAGRRGAAFEAVRGPSGAGSPSLRYRL